MRRWHEWPSYPHNFFHRIISSLYGYPYARPVIQNECSERHQQKKIYLCQEVRYQQEKHHAGNANTFHRARQRFLFFPTSTSRRTVGSLAPPNDVWDTDRQKGIKPPHLVPWWSITRLSAIARIRIRWLFFLRQLPSGRCVDRHWGGERWVGFCCSKLLRGVLTFVLLPSVIFLISSLLTW